MCYGQGASGRLCPRSLEVPVQSTSIFWSGSGREFLCACGARASRSMRRWKELRGVGKALMGRQSKRHWRWKPWVPTQRIGEKNGSKRSLLVDGNGIPLSIVASGAQRHDVKLLEVTLDRIVVERPRQMVRKQHLCADKGYAGQPAQQAIQSRGYIPHVRQRGEERQAKRHNPRYRARRWVVERTHSWLNRFRKLLVRFEKLEMSHKALLELACALIVFRQIIPIYG